MNQPNKIACGTYVQMPDNNPDRMANIILLRVDDTDLLDKKEKFIARSLVLTGIRDFNKSRHEAIYDKRIKSTERVSFEKFVPIN